MFLQIQARLAMCLARSSAVLATEKVARGFDPNHLAGLSGEAMDIRRYIRREGEANFNYQDA